MVTWTIPLPQLGRDKPREAGAEARRQEQAREAGGPQDNATYACSCGHHFAGDVSTHVACPRCGCEQDW